MTWYTYILYKVHVKVPAVGHSGSRDTYVGMTNNLKERLAEHNASKCKATRGCSWKVAAYVTHSTRADASLLERWLKVGDSRTKRVRLVVAADHIGQVPLEDATLAMDAARLWEYGKTQAYNRRNVSAEGQP